MDKEVNKNLISRRKLIRLGLLVTGGIAITGLDSCKPKKQVQNPDKKQVANKDKKPGKPRPPARQFPADKFWFNTKNKILHYPVIYATREKFNDRHFSLIPLEGWEAMLDQGQARFTKEHSGIIFEHFALKGLSPTDDASLTKATSIAARAFGQDYFKSNQYSWRNYELMLLLVALNNSIPRVNKWQSFHDSVNNPEVFKLKMPKRVLWLKTREAFDGRVEYIAEKKTEYLQRLNKRITT